MRELIFKGIDKIKAVAWLASLLDALDSEKSYVVTVKQYRKKRSLNANSYAWYLIDELAKKLNKGKTEIYKSYIKEIGGVSDMVCVTEEAAERLCQHWTHKGLGWQTDTLKSKIKGCVNVVLYYGSSVYDTAQMSRLIELITQDCKEYEIETLEDMKLRQMLEAWGEEEEGQSNAKV